MTGLLGPLVFGLCIAWLLYRDARERSLSAAAWVVVVWVAIYGTRPVTSWLTGADQEVSVANYDEGNPAEALITLSLILLGLMTLLRRRVALPAVITANPWLSVAYLFWLLSVLWSDYPIITLKRLFKDVGNIVMVLVVLTEIDPSEAIKAVCARCAYICIPLSVLLIRYYPSVGRMYGGYNHNDLMYVGVAAHKNTLGALALVSALFLLWELLSLRERSRVATVTTASFVSRILVLSMCWYLLRIADSATSLVCAVFGSALLIITCSVPFVRRHPARLEAFGCTAMVVLLALNSLFAIKDAFVLSLGRDTTLTSRTEVWPILSQYQNNPLVGAGFSTFWAGSRLTAIHKAIGGIVQAHNGYLETYLNGGVIGLALLLILLLSAYWRVRNQLVLGAPDAGIRFVILFVALLHNYSEASFYKLSTLWFVTVFAIIDYYGHRRHPTLAAPSGAAAAAYPFR